MLPVKAQHRLKGGKIGPILPAKVNGSADIGARLAMLARGGAAHSRRKTNIGPTLCAAWVSIYLSIYTSIRLRPS